MRHDTVGRSGGEFDRQGGARERFVGWGRRCGDLVRNSGHGAPSGDERLEQPLGAAAECTLISVVPKISAMRVWLVRAW